MKAKRMILATLYIWMAGGMITALHAQENLDRMRKKTSPSHTVKLKTAGDSTEEITSVQITIVDDKPQLTDFLDAFEKDRKDAKVNMMKVKEDRVYYENFVFDKGEKRKTYSYLLRDDANGDILYTEGENPEITIQRLSFRADSLTRDIAKNFKFNKATFDSIGGVWLKADSLVRLKNIAWLKADSVMRNFKLDFDKFKININTDSIKREFDKAHRIFLMDNTTGEYFQIPKGKDLWSIQKEKEKPKFMIPEGSYIYINGEKLTAEEARKKGYDVETIAP